MIVILSEMETLRSQLGVYRNEKKKEFIIPWQAVVQLKKLENFENGWSSYKMFVIKDEKNNLKSHDFDRLITECGNTIFFHEDNIQIKGNIDEVVTVRADSSKDFTIARFERCVQNIMECRNPIIQKLLNTSFASCTKKLKIDREISILNKYCILSIEGCPGAGKSTLCSKFISKFHSRYKIIYLAPTHEQIQNMAGKLVDKKIDFLIMSDESRLNKSFTKFHNSNRSDYSQKQKNMIPLDNRVIISTINKPLKGLNKLEKTIVIIDEAGKVALIEALSAIYMINKLVFLLLAGDSKQLGCHSNSNVNIESCLEFTHQRECEIWELRNQYRFGDKINYPMSTIFYGSDMFPSMNKEANFIYIELGNCNHEKQVWCEKEARIVKIVFEYMSTKYQTRILTPYNNQQECLTKLGLCSISIDSAQGSEFEAAIVSLGRNVGHGFLTKKRLNVAFTRSARALIIIAHQELKNSIHELHTLQNIANINKSLLYFRST